MKVIIPMAGTGNRFVLKGYKQPKPLIKVNNKRIIEYILELFSEEDEIVFICNDTHLRQTDIRETLFELRPNSKIVSIPDHKKGPVFTVKPYFDLIDDNEEVLICYCDNPFIWNRNNFINYIKNNKYDGCILTHTGMHPHTLNSTKMAFLKINNDIVKEIKEKECYTENPLQEHASTGAYYFSRGEYIKKYFNELMDKDIHYNGEYYVTLVYNLLIKDGLKVGFYDTDFVTVFGTPEEVESFEAWNTILKSGQVKNESELIQCYKYWKAYHENNIR
jgi:NDP-sugar pyrophosphorylase family protein